MIQATSPLFVYEPLLAEPEIPWHRFNHLMSQNFEYSDQAFPDFMLIGGPRSGTTWIYQSLLSHPYFYSDETKEFQYFTWNWTGNGIETYRRRFEGKPNKVKGDLTNLYSLLPLEAIAAIQRFNPDLKLIYVIRDPISHVWSLARQDLRAGQRLFSGAEWKRENLTNSIFIQCFLHDYPLTAADHATLLTRWLSFFPRENFYICFNDDIRTRPDDILIEIQEFLSLSPILDPALLKFEGLAYPGISGEMDEELRTFLRTLWLTRTRKLADFLKTALQLDIPKDWDSAFSGPYISEDIPVFEWPEVGTCFMSGGVQSGLFYSDTDAAKLDGTVERLNEIPFDMYYEMENREELMKAEITGPYRDTLPNFIPNFIIQKAFNPVIEKRLKRLLGSFFKFPHSPFKMQPVNGNIFGRIEH